MPKPRQRHDPQVRRARIIEQAIVVIGEKGYSGFTLKDLARRCDLTGPGLLHYFPSKEQVMLGLLGDLEAREVALVAPMVELARAEMGGDGQAAVLAILRKMLLRACAEPPLMRLFACIQYEALNEDHPAHDWWRTRTARTSTFFADLLAPFVDDPQVRARQVLAMRDGLALHWLHTGCAFDIAVEWNRALSGLLPELAASGDGAAGHHIPQDEITATGR